MANRFKWVLSPSKFEVSETGCPCFEDDPNKGKEYSSRGTDLHRYMELDTLDMAELEDDDQDAVQYCRDFRENLRSSVGKIVYEKRELEISPNDRHPRGTADWVLLVESEVPGKLDLFVTDWKFGVMAVPAAENNRQIKAYVLMATDELVKLGILANPAEQLRRLTGTIVQPALDLIDSAEYSMEEIQGIPESLIKANERVSDPFKKPDASDPGMCARCAHAHRCPLITTAIVTFVEKAMFLPMPENFEPGALVSERDRVIAHDLATILQAWALQIKANNKEFAARNGNTIGGIYNLSERGNGYAVKDVLGVAQGLVQAGYLTCVEDIFKYVNIAKGKLVDGLTEMAVASKGEVTEVVQELIEKHGEPRPNVMVLRRGGKKAVSKQEALLNVPMLPNPWKSKEE